MNNLRKHIRSYGYAFRGISIAFIYETNMRLHLVGALAVLILNCVLHVTRIDWILTLGLVALVLMAEIFNTAIERLSDRVTKQQDAVIRDVKDLAAGAVLIICIFAVVCAFIVYLPYLR